MIYNSRSNEIFSSSIILHMKRFIKNEGQVSERIYPCITCFEPILSKTIYTTAYKTKSVTHNQYFWLRRLEQWWEGHVTTREYRFIILLILVAIILPSILHFFIMDSYLLFLFTVGITVLG
jgi:hypothetical protein